MGDHNSATTVPDGFVSNRAIPSSGFPKYTPDFEWKFYKSLVENYFALNGVKDIIRQKELFITYLPEELLNIVIGVIGLQCLSSITIEGIFDRLTFYFEAEVPIAVHRSFFFRRVRGDYESISDYAIALRVLSEHCNFGDSTEETLCMCFKIGLNHEKLQQMLEKFYGATFDDLVRRAAILEHTVAGDNKGRGDDGDAFIKVEPVEVLTCEFKDMGCEFEGSHIEMNRHHVLSSAKHVLLSNNFLQKKLDVVEQHNISLKQEIQVMKQQMLTHEKTINGQTTSIESQEKNYSVLQKDVLALKRPAHVWCISGVAAHIKSSCKNPKYMISSKTFYAWKNGYCTSAFIYFNKTPNQIGIHIQLHPGEYDAILPWPFRQRVRFTLHQLSGGETQDIRMSFVSDPIKWGACKEPPKGANSTGWGFPEFISHDLLLKHYVKEDKMYITIAIEDP